MSSTQKKTAYGHCVLGCDYDAMSERVVVTSMHGRHVFHGTSGEARWGKKELGGGWTVVQSTPREVTAPMAGMATVDALPST
jgi:hypothetical protein